MNDRILLKISGEMFASDGNSFDPQKIYEVAQSIFDFKTQCNVDLVIVVGAGNLGVFETINILNCLVPYPINLE